MVSTAPTPLHPNSESRLRGQHRRGLRKSKNQNTRESAVKQALIDNGCTSGHVNVEGQHSMDSHCRQRATDS